MIEPPKNSDYAELTAEFRKRLGVMEYRLRQVKLDPVMIEGFRTAERQNWIFTNQPKGSTKCDGIIIKSVHQFRQAADYWFRRNGKIWCPPNEADEWKELRACALDSGLVGTALAGDLDHVQMPGVDTHGRIPDKEGDPQ